MPSTFASRCTRSHRCDLKAVAAATSLALLLSSHGSPRAQEHPASKGSPEASDFVKSVATTDGFTIQTSRLAVPRLPDGPAKELANKIIVDDMAMLATLKEAATSLHIQLPTALDKNDRQQVATLRNQQGGDFLKVFLDDQIRANTDAIALLRQYAESGDEQSLRDWANASLPALENHLYMAHQLQTPGPR